MQTSLGATWVVSCKRNGISLIVPLLCLPHCSFLLVLCAWFACVLVCACVRSLPLAQGRQGLTYLSPESRIIGFQAPVVALRAVPSNTGCLLASRATKFGFLCSLSQKVSIDSDVEEELLHCNDGTSYSSYSLAMGCCVGGWCYKGGAACLFFFVFLAQYQ